MVFAASVAVYFFAARKNMQKEEAVYSSMDAPEFPVVYTELMEKRSMLFMDTFRIWETRWQERVFPYFLRTES